jgi:hypothetical protein
MSIRVAREESSCRALENFRQASEMKGLVGLVCFDAHLTFENETAGRDVVRSDVEGNRNSDNHGKSMSKTNATIECFVVEDCSRCQGYSHLDS